MMPEKKKRRSPKRIDKSLYVLEEWMEQTEEILAQRPSWNLKNCTMEPLREIGMTATEVIMTVDLPFTLENTVQVRPTDNSLEILAQMKRKLHLHELGVSHHIGEIQKFHCHVQIPVPVKMDRMSIKYKKGILEIHIPRKH